MVDYVSIAVSGGITFTFYLAPQAIFPSLDKSGLSPMAIPGTIRPMGFDAETQDRTIKINFTLMSLTAYSTPGTGTILDQIADLELIADSTGLLCTVSVPYPEALSAGHTFIKNGTTWNEYGVGMQFTPSSNIRKFFCVVQSMNIDYDVGGLVRQKGTVILTEVDQNNINALV